MPPLPRDVRQARAALEASVATGKLEDLQEAVKFGRSIGLRPTELAAAEQALLRLRKLHMTREKAKQWERDMARRKKAQRSLKIAYDGRDYGPLKDALADCLDVGIFSEAKADQIHDTWCRMNGITREMRSPLRYKAAASEDEDEDLGRGRGSVRGRFGGGLRAQSAEDDGRGRHVIDRTQSQKARSERVVEEWKQAMQERSAEEALSDAMALLDTDGSPAGLTRKQEEQRAKLRAAEETLRLAKERVAQKAADKWKSDTFDRRPARTRPGASDPPSPASPLSSLTSPALHEASPGETTAASEGRKGTFRESLSAADVEAAGALESMLAAKVSSRPSAARSPTQRLQHGESAEDLLGAAMKMASERERKARTEAMERRSTCREASGLGETPEEAFAPPVRLQPSEAVASAASMGASVSMMSSLGPSVSMRPSAGPPVEAAPSIEAMPFHAELSDPGVAEAIEVEVERRVSQAASRRSSVAAPGTLEGEDDGADEGMDVMPFASTGVVINTETSGRPKSKIELEIERRVREALRRKESELTEVRTRLRTEAFEAEERAARQQVPLMQPRAEADEEEEDWTTGRVLADEDELSRPQRNAAFEGRAAPGQDSDTGSEDDTFNVGRSVRSFSTTISEQEDLLLGDGVGRSQTMPVRNAAQHNRISAEDRRRQTEDIATSMEAQKRLRMKVIENERQQSEALKREADKASKVKPRDSLAATNTALQHGFSFAKRRLFKQALVLDVGNQVTRVRWTNEKELLNEVKTADLVAHLGSKRKEAAEVEMFKQPIKKNPVLLTADFRGDLGRLQKLIETFFNNTYQCPGVFVAARQTLALLASGRKSGVIVDVGADCCLVTPIHEGMIVYHAVQKCEHISGKAVDDMFKSRVPDLLEDDDPSERIRKLKEKHCRVHADYRFESTRDMTVPPMQVQLETGGKPGKFVEIRYGILVATTELYFKPYLASGDKNLKSLTQVIVDAVQACDPDVRPLLCRNIYTMGRALLFPGLCERLAAELRHELPPFCSEVFVRQATGQATGDSAALGALRLGEMESFPHMLYEREQYSMWDGETDEEMAARWASLWDRCCW